MTARLAALVLALATLLSASPARALPNAATPTQDAGDPLRERLKSLAPRWYDAEHDTWRSVEVQPPKPPQARDVELPGVSALVSAIAWLVAAAVLIVLAWLIWQVLPKGDQPPLDTRERDAAVPGELRATLVQLDLGEADDPEAALEAAKRGGNWPRAVVWLYAILLLRLDRAGVVRVRRGATNRRYRLEVAAWTQAGEAVRAELPVLLETVDAVIAAFERVYFGQQPAERADVLALEAQLRQALRAIAGEVER